MAELSSFFQDSREAILDLGGEPLKVSYNPGRITVNDFQRIQGLEDANVVVAGSDMATILSHTLVSWDLTQDGEPVRTDLDTLRDLPPIFVASVLTGLLDDLSPKAETGSTLAESPVSSPLTSQTPHTAGAPEKKGTPAQRAPRGSRSTS